VLNFINTYIVKYWWLPTLISLFSLIFGLAYSKFTIYAIFLPLIVVCLLFICGLIQLIYKKWIPGLLNLVVSVAVLTSAISSGFLFFFAMALDSGDHFTDDLVIPQELEFDFPIDLADDEGFELARPDFIEERDHLDFQLYNSFQPGLFEYDVWIETDVPGEVYFKAYEVSKEIPLSEGRLKDRSTIIIEATHDSIRKFSSKGHFTIYEGDWGDPYGARFELWFMPEGGEEYKLLEKNYIIEGWMR